MRFSPVLQCIVWVGLAFALGAPHAEGAKPDKNAPDDARQLEGDWKVVGLEADGRAASAEQLKGMRWSFKGSEVQFADPGEKPGGKSSVKLDPSKTPKRIDLVGVEGPVKGKTIQGIYKFEKDRLVICLRDPGAADKGRPTEFKTAADSGLGMITLERAKK